MKFLKEIKERASALRRDTLAVWYASFDKRTPWYAKVLAALVAAYAFSPVDLIPDFIPVFGYLDDLVLVPAGIALVVKLIPAAVMTDAREKARLQSEKPVNWIVGGTIILIWIAALFFIGRAVLRLVLIKH